MGLSVCNGLKGGAEAGEFGFGRVALLRVTLGHLFGAGAARDDVTGHGRV